MCLLNSSERKELKVAIKMLSISKGFTVLELLTVITVFAISASIATPSYKYVVEKYRLKGAVEEIVSNLQSTRAEAIKVNSDTYTVFTVGGNWEMRSSNTLACAVSATGCTAGDWEKIVNVNEYSGTNIDTTTLTSNRVTFDYIRGTSNIGAITLSLNNYSVKIKLNKLGYFQVCSNNQLTEAGMGYVAC